MIFSDPDFDFGSDPASDYGEKSKTILVSNLPTRANKDYLEMFFENTKKQGGGPVKSVDMNEEEDAAIIEFFEPECEHGKINSDKDSFLIFRKICDRYYGCESVKHFEWITGILFWKE